MRLIGVFKPCWDSNGRLLWLNNSFWHKQGENLEWRVMDIIAPCHFWWERKKIVVIWSAVGKAGCTLWKMRACSGRHDPAPEWEREQLMWDTGESSSIPWSTMICYGTLLVTGKEQFMGESSMSPAALGGLLCCAQREELLFARGTSAWQAPGPGSQQNWQSADNILFLLWSTSFFWWDFESSAKAKMAVEGQSSSLIGEVYRECLNISKKKFMTALLFWTQIQKIWCTRWTVLKKEKRGKHFPGTSLWHVISPLLGKKKHPRENNDYST